MKLLYTTLFLFLATACFAQKQNVYFLKNNGTYVQQRDSADYIRVISEPDSGSVFYNIFEYYPNGMKKLLGKTSGIEPPKLEGTCIAYYKNGNKQSVINYKTGKPVGNEFDYYPNGKIYLQKKYPDIVTDLYDYPDYSIIAEFDSLGTALVTDSNGYYKGFDNKFKNVVEVGSVKNGKKDGQWKGHDEGWHINFTETYDNGKFLGGMSVGVSNDTIKYNQREVEPQFKGGYKAFGEFLGRNIVYPDYERAHNIEGNVILTFIVEKNGKVSDVKVIKNVSYNIDKEALRVINSSRNWVPGMEYGRPVRVSYTIPINFSLKD